MYGSTGASGAEGGERREGGKRGRRPGRKAQLDKQDMKAKLGKCIIRGILPPSLVCSMVIPSYFYSDKYANSFFDCVN